MSENQFSVSDHFVGKEPIVAEIYDVLLDSLRRYGPVTESAKKSSIHLDNTTGFAGIYTRKNYLLLHFRLDHPLESERIQKREQLSARRIKHTVRLEAETDVDEELLHWLQKAYELSG